MKFTCDDRNNFSAELKRRSEIQIKMIQTKQVVQLLNRARAGGTPVDTGELRLSSNTDLNNMVMGYTKEYAPHVEYGHRTVDGGYVPGQRFLHRNVEAQKPIYINDLRKELRNGT